MDPKEFERLLIAYYMQQMGGQSRQPSQGQGGLGELIKLVRGLGSGSAGGAAVSQGAGVGTSGTSAVTMGNGGVATIPAGAPVPSGYTAVGTSANGGTMVAPTKVVGAEATTPGASSGIGSYALPAIVAAAQMSNVWEGGLKDIARGRGNREDWTNDAVNRTPQGAIINMGLRALGKRSVGSMMGSGKSGAQRLRDDFRGDLKSLGVADDGYNVRLADGTTFNIGLDGKTRFKNVGENIDGKTERQAWDVDFSNPLAKFATDRLDPLIREKYGQDDASKKYFPGQYTGMLVNAVTSNAKSEQEILRNIESVLGGSELTKQGQGGQQEAQRFVRPGKGQVARVSAGMYMNDKGQVVRATNNNQALQQSYGQNRIPRRGSGK